MTPRPLDDATDDRPVPAWAKAAAAVVVVVLVCLTYLGVRKPTAQLGDFGAYYRAGRYVAAGGTPYQTEKPFGTHAAYMYCPAFAYAVCRPLAALPYVWAMRAFVTINWAATVGVVWLSMRLVPGGSPRQRFAAGVIACAAVASYLWADFHNGQVGTLLLLACLAWITLTLSGRPVWGGLCLSLAVGLKLYPALLAPYLLLRRRWWPGLIGLAGGLAVQFVLPAAFVGPSGMGPLHKQWLRFCLDTQVADQTIRTGNQSLLAVFARTPPISDGVHLFSPAGLARLEQAYPPIVAGLTGMIFVAIAVWWPDPAVAVSALLVWMTVAAPRAWTFNFAAELPAAVLMSMAVVRRRRWWPLAAVALVGLPAAAAINTNDWLGDPVGWSLVPQLVWHKHFLAAVLLAVAVVVVGRADVKGTDRHPTSPV